MFLGFANFSKRFIRNFSKIAMQLISIFWIINKSTSIEIANGFLSIKANNQNILGGFGTSGSGDLCSIVSGNIEDLLNF